MAAGCGGDEETQPPGQSLLGPSSGSENGPGDDGLQTTPEATRKTNSGPSHKVGVTGVPRDQQWLPRTVSFHF